MPGTDGKTTLTMKRILIFCLLAFVAFSCGYRSQPAEPGDGSRVISISSPRLSVEGKKIFIYYLRDGIPVRSQMQENMSLSDPVTVDPEKWEDYGNTLESVLLDPGKDSLYDFRVIEHLSSFVQSPDGELLFFTAWNPSAGKRDLYWIRATGGFPVKITSDDWWADFSVPFAFMEDKDHVFVDGSKSWVLLCLGSSPVSPNEIVAIWMDGSKSYLSLSHDNDSYREANLRGLWQELAKMETQSGNTVHYFELSAENTVKGKEMLYYANAGESPVAWNEEAIKKVREGSRVFTVSKNELKTSDDEFEVKEKLLCGFNQSE